MKGSPLSKQEVAELQETAEQRDKKNEKLVVNIIPHTGLTVYEFIHLRRSWIRWNDPDNSRDPLLIKIPAVDSCVSLKSTTGGTTTRRISPCCRCRNEGETDAWEAAHGARERKIPVLHDQAINMLREWFNVYDTVAMADVTMRNALKTVQRKSNLEREVNPKDLRMTFVAMLAAMEYDMSEILEWTGLRYASSIRPILDDSPTDYRERLQSRDLLETLKANGPLTAAELAERVEKSPMTIRKRLNFLSNQHYVNREQKRSNGENGPNPMTWSCNTVPSSFSCSDCDREFSALSGLITHRGHSHDTGT